MEIQKVPAPSPSINLGPAVLPYSLDIISDFLKDFVPPQGPFDPAGSWVHRYYSVVALRGNAGKSNKTGYLRIHRDVTPSGIEFSMSQMIGIGGNRRELYEARAKCAADSLSTPSQWEVHSVLTGTTDNKAIDYT